MAAAFRRGIANGSEPFFTTRRDEGGTGMGLGIIAALLKAHGGTIRLLDTERGAGFEMRLPGGGDRQ
jgi:signal transduction histidine kinase